MIPTGAEGAIVLTVIVGLIIILVERRIVKKEKLREIERNRKFRKKRDRHAKGLR